jgi:hypothetical protein
MPLEYSFREGAGESRGYEPEYLPYNCEFTFLRGEKVNGFEIQPASRLPLG